MSSWAIVGAKPSPPGSNGSTGNTDRDRITVPRPAAPALSLSPGADTSLAGRITASAPPSKKAAAGGEKAGSREPVQSAAKVPKRQSAAPGKGANQLGGDWSGARFGAGAAEWAVPGRAGGVTDSSLLRGGGLGKSRFNISTYHGVMSQEVELTPLRLLVLIGSLGSLGKASRHLGMAQPNASRILARYERRTGLHLVERSPSGSRLSLDGELVATWAEEVLRAADAFHHAVSSLGEEFGSHLTVGASQTIAEYLAPRWLARFHSEHPEVEVTLRVANSRDTLRSLGVGEVDIGFVESLAEVTDMRVGLLREDELVLVAAPEHLWARRADPVDAEELAAAELVVREPGSGTRGTLDAFLAGWARADPALQVSTNSAVLGSVIAGVAPAVLSRLVVQSALDTGQVVEVPTAGVELRRALRVVWPDATLSPAASDFLAVARAESAGR